MEHAEGTGNVTGQISLFEDIDLKAAKRRKRKAMIIIFPKPKEITYIDPPCRCNAYDFPHYHPEGKRYSDVYTFGKG